MGDPDFSRSSRPAADRQEICRRLARYHRSRSMPARARDLKRPPFENLERVADARRAAIREPQNTTHYSVVDSRGQRRRRDHHAQRRIRLARHRRRPRLPAQRRDGRLRLQARCPQHLWTDPGPGQRHRPRQAPAVGHDADHRSQGRQALPRPRLAGRSQHHHDRCQHSDGRGRFRARYPEAVNAPSAFTISGFPIRFSSKTASLPIQ